LPQAEWSATPIFYGVGSFSFGAFEIQAPAILRHERTRRRFASLIEFFLRRWPFMARSAFHGIGYLRPDAVELDLKMTGVASLMKRELICQRRDSRATGVFQFRDRRE